MVCQFCLWQVVRAMLAILEKAVKDKTASYDRFIFGTGTKYGINDVLFCLFHHSNSLNRFQSYLCESHPETCIPLYSLLQTGERLFSGEMSWLDAYNEPQVNALIGDIAFVI